MKSAALDDPADLECQVSLGQALLGMVQPEVGEDVAAALLEVRPRARAPAAGVGLPAAYVYLVEDLLTVG
jgi:hypothetical protein